MSKYIHRLTEEAAIEVASKLLPEDRAECVEGHGLDPEQSLLTALDHDSVYFRVPSGDIAGAAGVHGDGQIWMLCTEAIHQCKHTFVKEAKRFVDQREEKLLWNIVDSRNDTHLKLLRFLGFKFLRKFPYGPNNIPFIEFCRVQSRSTRGSIIR